MPLKTPGHVFVAQYLREAKARGAFEGLDPDARFTRSQQLLAEAWQIARERHIVQNPSGGRTMRSNPVGGDGSPPGPIFNPLPSERAMKKRQSQFGSGRRDIETRLANVEDQYYAALQRYGPDHGITKVLAQRLDHLLGAVERARWNPKMPVGYYRGSPITTPVVVRQYERRLPKRPVTSHETLYRRLRPGVARGVALRHDNEGDQAWAYERTQGGASHPYITRRRPRRNPVSNPHKQAGMAMFWSAIVLGALTVFGRR